MEGRGHGLWVGSCDGGNLQNFSSGCFLVKKVIG